jgi:uncharacterized protein
MTHQLRLPLFPLSTVLFPGAPLTLHIFEARYRLMISQCIEEQQPFGVILIHDGGEVGDAGVVPYSVGTTAQITENVRLDDGRYYIATVGRQRFRVEYLTQRQPFLMAEVALLDEDPSPQARGWAEELRRLYERYWAAMRQLTGQNDGAEELDSDPVLLSYQLAHLLQVPNERKQAWLEGDTLTRLREIGGALRRELLLLPRSSRGNVGSESTIFGSWN